MKTASYDQMIVEAESLAPDLVRRSFLDRFRSYVPFLIGVAIFVWICIDVDIAPAMFLSGFSRLGDFLGNMFPPSSGGQLPRILNALVETFGMAFAGTFLGVVFAIPLGIIGAKNIVSFGPVHFIIRRVFETGKLRNTCYQGLSYLLISGIRLIIDHIARRNLQHTV